MAEQAIYSINKESERLRNQGPTIAFKNTTSDLTISHKSTPLKGPQHLSIAPPRGPNLEHTDLWGTFNIQTLIAIYARLA